jgi:WD40 repeat protein
VAIGASFVAVVDTKTGKLLHRLEFPFISADSLQGSRRREQVNKNPFNYYYDIHSLRFGPDGNTIYAGGADGQVNAADLTSGQKRAPLGVHPGGVRSLAITPDGGILASGGEDGTIRLWEVPAGREMARWDAHESAVTALAFRPRGNILVSGSKQGTLRVWDLARMRRELAELGLDWDNENR